MGRSGGKLGRFSAQTPVAPEGEHNKQYKDDKTQSIRGEYKTKMGSVPIH